MNRSGFFEPVNSYSGILELDNVIREIVSGDVTSVTDDYIARIKSRNREQYFGSNYLPGMDYVTIINALLQISFHTENLPVIEKIGRTANLYYNDFSLMIYSVFSEKTSLMEALIPNDTSVNIFQVNNRPDAELLHDPFYWLLISGSYKKAPHLIKKFLQFRFSNNAALFAVISALMHKENDFIGLMFRSGFTVSEELYANLIPYPDMINYLAENFGKYIFPEGTPAPASVPDIIESSLTDQSSVVRLYNILLCDLRTDLNTMKQYVPYLPKISVINSKVNFLFTIDDMPELGKLTLAPVIDYYIEGDVTDSDIDIANTILADSKITYHLSDNTCFWSRNALTQLLKKAIVLERTTDGFSLLLSAVLDSQNRSLYRLAIKKGIIDNKNFDAAAEYLVNNNSVRGIRYLYELMPASK